MVAKILQIFSVSSTAKFRFWVLNGEAKNFKQEMGSNTETCSGSSLFFSILLI